MLLGLLDLINLEPQQWLPLSLEAKTQYPLDRMRLHLEILSLVNTQPGEDLPHLLQGSLIIFEWIKIVPRNPYPS